MPADLQTVAQLLQASLDPKQNKQGTFISICLCIPAGVVDPDCCLTGETLLGPATNLWCSSVLLQMLQSFKSTKPRFISSQELSRALLDTSSSIRTRTNKYDLSL